MISAAAASLVPVGPAATTTAADGLVADGAAAQPFVAVLAAALAAPMVASPMTPPPVVPIATDGAPADEGAEESGGEAVTPVIADISGGEAAIVAPESALAGATESMRTVVMAVAEQNARPSPGSSSVSEPMEAVEAVDTDAESTATDEAMAGVPLPSGRAEATSGSAVVAASVAMPPQSRGGPTEPRQHGRDIQTESPRLAPAKSAHGRERAASATAAPQGADVAVARGTAAGVLAALSDRNAALLQAAEQASPRSARAGLVAPGDEPLAAPVPAPVPAERVTLPDGVVVVEVSEGDTDSGPMPTGLRAPLVVSARAGEVAQTMEQPARVVSEGVGEQPDAAALEPPSRRSAEVEPAAVAPERPAESQPSPRLPWVAAEQPSADVIPDALPPRAAPERTPVRVAAPSPSFVTVELDPETSGAQRVRVAVRGDAVHATVVTDPVGAEAMRPQLGELRQALEGQGFREATVQLRTSGEATMATPIAAGQDVRARGESGPASDGQPGDPHARGRQRGQDHQPPGQGRRPDPEEEMA